jgi:hypothetical protein
MNRLCVCGHPRTYHLHYRAGTDCSHCDCERYVWRWLSWAILP